MTAFANVPQQRCGHAAFIVLPCVENGTDTVRLLPGECLDIAPDAARKLRDLQPYVK